MKLKWSPRLLVTISFAALFLITTYESYEKFRSNRKSEEDLKQEVEEVDYPSVTVCVEYTFKNAIDGILSSRNSTFPEIERLVRQNTWDRGETFYFVDHPSTQKPGFPCMTTKVYITINIY